MTALTVVPTPAQSLAERIASLQQQRMDLGREHVARMVALLSELHDMARAASSFGDAIPVGIRERSDRIAHDCSAYRDDLMLFSDRAKR